METKREEVSLLWDLIFPILPIQGLKTLFVFWKAMAKKHIFGLGSDFLEDMHS